jgi:hypothetical protein
VWVAGLLLSFVLGLLFGLSGWVRRRFVLLAALVVVVISGVVVAWCSVFPQMPSMWPYTDVLWEFRSLNPSWPFWVGGGSLYEEADFRILYFLGYPVIERLWILGHLNYSEWRAMVYQEFLMWLSVINVVSGILGFFVSWSVVRRFRLRDSGR